MILPDNLSINYYTIGDKLQSFAYFLMDKTSSSSCYDAIIIKQKNRNYKSTAFQVVFSSNLMKLVQKNRAKNMQPYKLTMFVNEQQVILPMKIDDSGRVVFQKQYMRKMSMFSDSSDVSDDELSQKSSTIDSRFNKPNKNTNKSEKFQDLKNQQAPKTFWQFAWLFKEKKGGQKPKIQHPNIQQSQCQDQTKLSKIKQEVYEGQENSKQPLFHLSLCGSLLRKKQKKQQILKTFYEHRIQYKDFIKDPPAYLNDSDLVVKIDDSIYTWQLGNAILTCRFAYGKQLSKELIEDITKNKFTKSKLFPFFSKDPITKLQLKQIHQQQKQKKVERNKNAGFRKMQRSDLSILKYRKTPDSQIVKKMKLKYGKNQAKFVLDVGHGLKEQINMKIFLWDSSQKIVISDIDGTITKSDILGQILSKWIHPGVTKLFTQICKRQYKVVYLTARAIGQYQQTCKFLQTVEQDGIPLPQGPLLMSPDGYMRSLTRQVLYKTPDYLKTKILAGLNQLFPNTKTPIYCGFGNRQTDSAAYLRINIPADKIYEITEKSTITRQSDKEFTSTYLDILENIAEFFPQYLKQNDNYKSSDEEVEQFEAVAQENIQYVKAKSVQDSADRDLDGFDQKQLQQIQTISRSRKSQHDIPQQEVKGMQQFMKQMEIQSPQRLKQQVDKLQQQSLLKQKQRIQQEQRKEHKQQQQKQKNKEVYLIVEEALKQKKQQKEGQFIENQQSYHQKDDEQQRQQNQQQNKNKEDQFSQQQLSKQGSYQSQQKIIQKQ